MPAGEAQSTTSRAQPVEQEFRDSVQRQEKTHQDGQRQEAEILPETPHCQQLQRGDPGRGADDGAGPQEEDGE